MIKHYIFKEVFGKRYFAKYYIIPQKIKIAFYNTNVVTILITMLI